MTAQASIYYFGTTLPLQPLSAAMCIWDQSSLSYSDVIDRACVLWLWGLGENWRD